VRDKVTALSRGRRRRWRASGARRAAAPRLAGRVEQKEALAERLQRLPVPGGAPQQHTQPPRVAPTRTPWGRWTRGMPAQSGREFSRALDVARLEVKRCASSGTSCWRRCVL